MLKEAHINLLTHQTPISKATKTRLFNPHLFKNPIIHFPSRNFEYPTSNIPTRPSFNTNFQYRTSPHSPSIYISCLLPTRKKDSEDV